MKFRIWLTSLIVSIPLTAMSSVTALAQACPTIQGHSCCTNSEYVKLCKALGIWKEPRAQTQNTQTRNLSDEKSRQTVREERQAKDELAAAEKAERSARKELELAKKGHEAAETAIEVADERLEKLQRQADATNNTQEKIKILQQKLETTKTKLELVRSRDALEESIKKHETKLKVAGQNTANAKAKVEKATQARIAAVVKKAPSASKVFEHQKVEQAKQPSAISSPTNQIAKTTSRPSGASASQSTSSATPPNTASSQSYNTSSSNSSVGRSAVQSSVMDLKPGTRYRAPDSRAANELLPYSQYSQLSYNSTSDPFLLKERTPDFEGSRQLGGGFKVETFVEHKGGKRLEVVAAFAGTKFTSAGDLITDAGQITMGGQYTEQYRQAGIYAADLGHAVTKLRNAGYDVDITFTGHSLGGGLAQVASVGTVVEVDKLVTFNSAGLSGRTVKYLDNSVRTSGYTMPKKVIHARVDGDPVSAVGLHLKGDLYQFNHGGITNHLRPVRNHRLGPFIELIDDKATSQ